jgi:hypothetical protein
MGYLYQNLSGPVKFRYRETVSSTPMVDGTVPSAEWASIRK